MDKLAFSLEVIALILLLVNMYMIYRRERNQSDDKTRLAEKMNRKAHHIEDKKLNKERRKLLKAITNAVNNCQYTVELDGEYIPILEKDSKNYYYLIKQGFNIAYDMNKDKQVTKITITW